MLLKFRRRLVALNITFVGLILIAVCFFSYQYSGNAIMASHKESFNSTCSLFENKLSLQKSFIYRNINELEQSDQLYIYITDNGINVELPYFKDNTFREELYSSALLELSSLEQDSKNTTASLQWVQIRRQYDFITHHQGTDFFSRYASIPNTYGTWLDLLILQPMDSYYDELFRTRCFYIFLTITGFVIIALLNYSLAKKAIQPAIAAEAAQKEFIASAGHELKSPLAVILSSADMLVVDQCHYQEYQSNISSEAKRMARLVDDMLLLARLGLEHTEIERKIVDAEALLISTYEKFLPIAKDSSHVLNLNLPDEELPSISIDEERIVQVLSILLTNAFSYTPMQTAVEITAFKQNKLFCISVVDHGVGIAEKKKVFDKFYRSEKGRSQKQHFGLGLSIAAEIVRMHCGEITLTDTLGGGATFTICLPMHLS